MLNTNTPPRAASAVTLGLALALALASAAHAGATPASDTPPASGSPATEGLAGVKLGQSWADVSASGKFKDIKCEKAALGLQGQPLVDQSCTATLTAPGSLAGMALGDKVAIATLNGAVVLIGATAQLPQAGAREATLAWLQKLETSWGSKLMAEPGTAIFMGQVRDRASMTAAPALMVKLAKDRKTADVILTNGSLMLAVSELSQP